MLSQCQADISHDASTYGISCTKNLVQFQEIFVEYQTDISRLKVEAASLLPRKDSQQSSSTTFWVLANATVLTMETGKLETDLIENAFVVVKDGVIDSILEFLSPTLPADAIVLDVQGCELILIVSRRR
jgi:hypothetical protein